MEVKLFDFQTITRDDTFVIQMFGLNEKGETFSLEISDFKPCFYCRVPDWYEKTDKAMFLEHIKTKTGLSDSILECALIKKKKLDGFDGQKQHKFICFKFKGLPSFHRVKNLWYHEIASTVPSKFNKKEGFAWTLRSNGYVYRGHSIYLYESNIPPLLRYFHIKNLSPSGWVQLTDYEVVEEKTTTCTYEFIVNAKNVEPLKKDTIVPYKICSFDIEASSSHGDFPLPIKDYKKLAQNIVEQFEHYEEDKHEDLLCRCIHAAFGYDTQEYIDIVYPKKKVSQDMIQLLFAKWVKNPLKKYVPTEMVVEQFEESSDEEESVIVKEYNQECTVVDMMKDVAFDKESKTNELQKGLNHLFPALEGDKVTFIGSTFVKYGVNKPYLNHCIVLGGCEPIENTELESYKTEEEVLMAWQKLIQREDPDILIGYNIFGFDSKFLFHRAVETGCIADFLKLSRNGSLAGKYDQGWKIEESTIFLASGEYNLSYFKMEGRLQIDLYTVFRRDYSLDSYKLDSVSAYFIGDKVTHLMHNEETNQTYLYSKNLSGLEKLNYVVFEEVSNSSDFYKNGKKFRVVEVHADYFVVNGLIAPNVKKYVKWCLAKDDVDHHDIFRMAKGSDADRACIAGYCIQDCNLVHHLFQKTDLLTEVVEMAAICSVPIEFIIMRGQGIKLASLVFKKCRENGILIPVIQKMEQDGGYEGAIVLDPKCGIYFDTPVAVTDYKSLYPSTMISDNLSHDSLVYVKTYNVEGELIREVGEKRNGVFIYDNLPEYTYVDVQSDTYIYVRKTPKAAAVKQVSGYIICRFAQFPEEKKGIIPLVLEELLTARKNTRKLIPLQQDPFMAKILDKRQNAFKVTANSLYGQCGAMTSMFYNKYVAGSCTAGGRKMLNYAKTLVEEVYCKRDCKTSIGMVNATAEYIYGDTDSVFFRFALIKEGRPLIGKEALGVTIELAKEAGELATMFLKMPHELEYEKTFYPFILLAKKKYVGILYEHDTEKCVRKSMGIVLKRRDNAKIVKDAYGSVIDILMQERDIVKSIEFVKKLLRSLVDGQIPIDKLIITKSLRSGYKKPLQMAHKVLADRIGKRDAGNKPKPGDRVRFVFVQTEKVKKKQLQGDKIETPEYINEHALKPDYGHYITNQIMKPLQQLYALILESIPGFKQVDYDVEVIKCKDDKKVEALRNKEVKKLIFNEFI